MNCFECRRQVDVSPGAPGIDAMLHVLECPRCAQRMKAVLEFEKQLLRAFDVPVPAGLEDRIALRCSSGARPHREATRVLRFARAAGLVFAIAIAGTGGGYLYGEARLERELVKLVEIADYALVSLPSLPQSEITSALRPVGLGLDASPGEISFAGRCLVRGNPSGHLVLREREQAVTIFLMPEQYTLRRVRFEREGWTGVLVPAGRGGTLAVMASSAQPLDEIAGRMLQVVRWSAAPEHITTALQVLRESF